VHIYHKRHRAQKENLTGIIVNSADKPVRDLLCICAFNLFCWVLVLLALEAGLGFGCATAIVVGFVLLMELEVRDMAGIKGYKR
jgi:hypothetical protein